MYGIICTNSMQDKSSVQLEEGLGVKTSARFMGGLMSVLLVTVLRPHFPIPHESGAFEMTKIVLMVP